MSNEEYDRQMKEVTDKFKSKCKKIRQDYVRSNMTVEIGDIVEDHGGKIIVEKWGVHIPVTGYPGPMFHGTCLRKDGLPRKDGSKRWLYSSNMI